MSLLTICTVYVAYYHSFGAQLYIYLNVVEKLVTILRCKWDEHAVVSIDKYTYVVHLHVSLCSAYTNTTKSLSPLLTCTHNLP